MYLYSTYAVYLKFPVMSLEIRPEINYKNNELFFDEDHHIKTRMVGNMS